MIEVYMRAGLLLVLATVIVVIVYEALKLWRNGWK